jgi:chromosomal replication initiation ATPase DnaA
MEELFILGYKTRLQGKSKHEQISVHPVIREAIQKFNVTADDIISHKTGGDLRNVRKWIARKLRRRGMSYPDIGKILNRSHTSIMSLLGAR